MSNLEASIDAIYVLKVNIQCCNACPKKIKRKLLRVSGVCSVTMDTAEGLVRIGGRDNLDPLILIKTVAKTGKIAQLQSIQKTAGAGAIDSGQPSNPSGNAENLCNNICETQNSNSGSYRFSDHSGRSGQIHINEPAAVRPPPPRIWPFMRPPPSQFGGFRPRMMELMQPTPPMVTMPPLLPPAQGYYRWPEPPPAHGYNRWPEPPQEVPPPYGYHRWPEPPPDAPPCCCHQHPPPAGNAPGHYLFSDDNIDVCVIV